MINLAIWLASFGVADLIAPVSGKQQLELRTWLAFVLSGTTACGLAVAVGESPGGRALATAVVVTTYAGWVWLRVKVEHADPKEQPAEKGATERRHKELLAGWTIGYLMVVFIAVAASAAFLSSPSGGTAREFSAKLPYAGLADVEFPRLILGLGFFVFLQASANAVVRLSLASIGTRVHKAEQTLKGGRLIGPLERSLIFGFALVGAPTAAALVVSAKGLLRFPELNDMRSDEKAVNGTKRIDEVTEYLLVGSLVSWLLALAPIPFIL